VGIDLEELRTRKQAFEVEICQKKNDIDSLETKLKSNDASKENLSSYLDTQ
jgi:hypothetical protein